MAGKRAGGGGRISRGERPLWKRRAGTSERHTPGTGRDESEGFTRGEGWNARDCAGQEAGLAKRRAGDANGALDEALERVVVTHEQLGASSRQRLGEARSERRLKNRHRQRQRSAGGEGGGRSVVLHECWGRALMCSQGQQISTTVTTDAGQLAARSCHAALATARRGCTKHAILAATQRTLWQGKDDGPTCGDWATRHTPMVNTPPARAK